MYPEQSSTKYYLNTKDILNCQSQPLHIASIHDNASCTPLIGLERVCALEHVPIYDRPPNQVLFRTTSVATLPFTPRAPRPDLLIIHVGEGWIPLR